MAETSTFEATIERTQPLTVAFQQLHGSYDEIPKGFQRLYGWAGPRGHDITGPPMATYLSPPDTPPEHSLFETWVPIEDGPTVFGPDESGLGIKAVPAMDVAKTDYTGPYDGVGEVYGRLMSWIAEHDYAVAGPPIEIYLNSPREVSPEQLRTQILVPIQEK